jgi:heat shock protein HslJ
VPRLAVIPGTALLVVLLASCGGGSGSGSSSQAVKLDGTSWSLATVAGADALPGGMLGFSGGKLSGATGCNSFGGSYTQSGDSLTISLGPMTMIGCPPPLDAQERAVVNALPKTASFAIRAGKLVLLDGPGTALLAYTHLDSSAMVGPKWEVTGVNTGNAVSSPVPGTKLTATFGADGTVAGSAGCNTYSAGYTLTGDALAIQPAASTRMHCESPAGVMEQESAFLAALEHSTKVGISSHGVTLRDSNGAIQVTLAEPG